MRTKKRTMVKVGVDTMATHTLARRSVVSEILGVEDNIQLTGIRSEPVQVTEAGTLCLLLPTGEGKKEHPPTVTALIVDTLGSKWAGIDIILDSEIAKQLGYIARLRPSRLAHQPAISHG